MKALIDGDIFQWEFGAATDDEFKPLAWPLVQTRIDARIRGILEATGADEYQIYLTSDDKSNFRYDIATIRPYKGHRATEKPFWYYGIRGFLIDHRGAQEVSGQEADDALSIAQWKDIQKGLSDLGYNPEIKYNNITAISPIKKVAGTIICSRDKDLHMVPGWHYTWPCGKQKEKELWWQSELGGLKCFYKQLITGDNVDNIPGLYNVGKYSKLLTDIEDCTSEFEMYDRCFSEYEKRFGSYAEQFLLENGRLLWMRRYEGQLWEPPKDKECSTESA